MYRVCSKKAVFDINGRKQEGEIVKGLKPKTIEILKAAGIIEEVPDPVKKKAAKKESADDSKIKS